MKPCAGGGQRDKYVVFYWYFCVFYLPCFDCILVVGCGGVGGINLNIFVWLGCIFVLFLCILFGLFLTDHPDHPKHHPVNIPVFAGGGMRGGGRDKLEYICLACLYFFLIFVYFIWLVFD